MDTKLWISICAFTIVQRSWSLPNIDNGTTLQTNVQFPKRNIIIDQPHDHDSNGDLGNGWQTVKPDDFVQDGETVLESQKGIVKENNTKKENTIIHKEIISMFEDKTVPRDELFKEENNKKVVENNRKVNRTGDQEYLKKGDHTENFSETKIVSKNVEHTPSYEKATFDVIDIPTTLISLDQTSEQTSTPLVAKSKHEDLIKVRYFLADDVNETPLSPHEFQLPNPMKEMDSSDDNVSPTTSKTTEANVETESANLPTTTQGSEIKDIQSIAWNTRNSKFIRNGIALKRSSVYRTNMGRSHIGSPSRTTILRPEALKDKFHVVRVYAKKPKSLERDPSQLDATQRENSDEFLNFYRQWTEGNANPRIDHVPETRRPKEIDRKPCSKETGVLNEDNTHAFDLQDPDINDENAIRRQIKNMLNLKMQKEQNNKKLDELDNVNFDNSKHDINDDIDHEIKETNSIRKQIEKLKTNYRSGRNAKVDRFFENIVKIVRKCNRRSIVKMNLFDCLKDQTLKSIEFLMFNSNRSLPIVNGYIYLEKDFPINRTEYSIEENRYLDYNRKILQAVNMFVNHLSLKFKLPADILLSGTTAMARHKKDKHGHLFLLMMFLVASTMLPVKMSMIAMMAGKALMISMVSLILTVLIGLKKISHGHGSGHTTYEVINVPASSGGHPSSGNPAYISRNLKYTTPATPIYSYSTYASTYDTEHEGEVTPDEEDTVITPDDFAISSDDERNYALSSEDKKHYALSSDDKRHYPLPSEAEKFYPLPSSVVEDDVALPTDEDKHYALYRGGQKKYSTYRTSLKHYGLPSSGTKNYETWKNFSPPSENWKNYVPSSSGTKNFPLSSEGWKSYTSSNDETKTPGGGIKNYSPSTTKNYAHSVEGWKHYTPSSDAIKHSSSGGTKNYSQSSEGLKSNADASSENDGSTEEEDEKFYSLSHYNNRGWIPKISTL